MIDRWFVPGTTIPFEVAVLYAEARHRVIHSRRLRGYMSIILDAAWASDANHLRWVIRSKVGEIESWASRIKEAASNA